MMGALPGGEALYGVIRERGQAEVLHDVEKQLFPDRAVEAVEPLDLLLGLSSAEAVRFRPAILFLIARRSAASDDVDHRLGFGTEARAERLEVGLGQRLWPVSGGEYVEDLRRGVVVGGVGLQEAQAREQGRHLPRGHDRKLQRVSRHRCLSICEVNPAPHRRRAC
jgi:hypothetical protein